MTERGLQHKSDSLLQSWEQGEFPMLCEGCLGESAFIRMIRDTYNGTCKMCSRPFTIFKWRSGHTYKKTEVCQTCSKIKNICQACILDLQYGLPSQLRDAVLEAVEGSVATSQCEVHQDYQAQQQLLAIDNGDNPWESRDGPNERLLRLARATAIQREKPRIQVTGLDTKSEGSSKRSHGNAFHGESTNSITAGDGLHPKAIKEDLSLPLPPGVESVAQLNAILSPTAPSATGATPSSASSSGKPIAKPPKPPGPPPAWAFKNKQPETPSNPNSNSG